MSAEPVDRELTKRDRTIIESRFQDITRITDVATKGRTLQRFVQALTNEGYSTESIADTAKLTRHRIWEILNGYYETSTVRYCPLHQSLQGGNGSKYCYAYACSVGRSAYEAINKNPDAPSCTFYPMILTPVSANHE